MSAADGALVEAPGAPLPELDRRFLQGDRRARAAVSLRVRRRAVTALDREPRQGLDRPRRQRPACWRRCRRYAARVSRSGTGGCIFLPTPRAVADFGIRSKNPYVIGIRGVPGSVGRGGIPRWM